MAEINIRLPEPNERQKLFLADTHKYVAYGGARGGGKSWAVRVKAILLAFAWPGIRQIIIRRTYPELQANHIKPMREMLPKGSYRYNDTKKRSPLETAARSYSGICPPRRIWTGSKGRNATCYTSTRPPSTRRTHSKCSLPASVP